MSGPLRGYLVEATDEARIERVHRRLRASRDSLLSRWGWHFAVAAAFACGFSVMHLKSAPELTAETQCVVIIKPAKPTQVIGDNC